MAGQDEVVLRQRVCRACNAVFVLCRSCDRGQRYCSPECRLPALRQQRRRANRRHQDSPEGRLDHRDRQRAYRKRCARRRVTDTSSPTLPLPGSMAPCPHPSEKTVVRLGFSASPLACRLHLSWPGGGGEHPHRPAGFASLCDLWSVGSFHRPISAVLGSQEVTFS